MTRLAAPPWSHPVRLNEIGAGVDRRLEADPEARGRIARALDLADLGRLSAKVELKPENHGWTLSGRLMAEATQTCGLTLAPLPVVLDRTFRVSLVEGAETPDVGEVEVSIEDEAPDVVEDGAIDLGSYVVEQLALNLDPFPRKPGAVFVAPEGPAETSPFAVLNRLRPRDGDQPA